MPTIPATAPEAEQPEPTLRDVLTVMDAHFEFSKVQFAGLFTEIADVKCGIREINQRLDGIDKRLDGIDRHQDDREIHLPRPRTLGVPESGPMAA